VADLREDRALAGVQALLEFMQYEADMWRAPTSGRASHAAPDEIGERPPRVVLFTDAW